MLRACGRRIAGVPAYSGEHNFEACGFAVRLCGVVRAMPRAAFLRALLDDCARSQENDKLRLVVEELRAMRDLQ